MASATLCAENANSANWRARAAKAAYAVASRARAAARLAAEDPAVERVCIWTPDKDLAQCVRGERVVQVLGKGSRRYGW